MFYRKKPISVEAFKLSFANNPFSYPQWFAFAIQDHTVSYQGGDDKHYTIKTLEGEMRANDGDYIIKGIKGELYPCKPDIFEATYEALGEATA